MGKIVEESAIIEIYNIAGTYLLPPTGKSGEVNQAYMKSPYRMAHLARGILFEKHMMQSDIKQLRSQVSYLKECLVNKGIKKDMIRLKYLRKKISEDDPDKYIKEYKELKDILSPGLMWAWEYK